MPEKAQTPGALLRDKLEKLGLPVYTVAKEMQISNALLYYIMNEKGPISVAAALRFAKYFNTTPEYWLTAQMKYDLEQAQKTRNCKTSLKALTGRTKKRRWKGWQR
jgi:addiction module HigA family antidote